MKLDEAGVISSLDDEFKDLEQEYKALSHMDAILRDKYAQVSISAVKELALGVIIVYKPNVPRRTITYPQLEQEFTVLPPVKKDSMNKVAMRIVPKDQPEMLEKALVLNKRLRELTDKLEAIKAQMMANAGKALGHSMSKELRLK